MDTDDHQYFDNQSDDIFRHESQEQHRQQQQQKQQHQQSSSYLSNLTPLKTIVIDGRLYKVCEQISPPPPSSASSSIPLPQSQPPLEGTKQQVARELQSATLTLSGAKRSSGSGGKSMHTCSVCGDRAFYVFYGALACDSCRTFFRRQVLQSKTLTCHFKGSCQVLLNTRKDCAKCRLDKCIRVGMKNNLVAVSETTDSTVNDPDQDLNCGNSKSRDFAPIHATESRNINEKDRSTSMSHSTPSSPVGDKSSKVNQESSVPLFRSWSGQELISTTPFSPVAYRSKKHLALLSNSVQEKSNSSNINLNNTSNKRPSLVARKTQSRSKHFSIKVPNSNDGSLREVNLGNLHLTEQEKLRELMVAVNKLELKKERNDNDLNNDDDESGPIMFSLCNVIYLATTRLVSAINSLKSFDFLPHSDQLTLLKGSISEMIFIWSVRAFDTESKSWKLSCFKNNLLSHSSELRLPMDVLKAAKHNDLSLYLEYDKFVGDFDPNLGKDYLLINILIAICLFNPDRDGLIEKDHVRCERNLYRSLLQKYLDSISDEKESSHRFTKLTSKIDGLTSLKDIYESSEVDPEDINQLVRTTKLLDIKNTM